jgi:hypothetical protein
LAMLATSVGRQTATADIPASALSDWPRGCHALTVSGSRWRPRSWVPTDQAVTKKPGG